MSDACGVAQTGWATDGKAWWLCPCGEYGSGHVSRRGARRAHYDHRYPDTAQARADEKARRRAEHWEKHPDMGAARDRATVRQSPR